MSLGSPELDVDLGRLALEILERAETLGLLSEEPDRLTRTFLSPPMHRVHALLADWMREAGMMVRLDVAANLVGRRETTAQQPMLPVVMIGSHLDTVPDAGKYDGILGVLLGLAAVKAMGSRPLPFAVEVVGFSEEEGVRYRVPYLGSLAMTGGFDPKLLKLADARGVLMEDAFREFGLDPALLDQARFSAGIVKAYFEAHIEQGPVLESWGLPVGVVSGLVGQSRLWVTFEGKAGHAGTSPMDLRRDALPAAAELILAVENLARYSEGLRGTVGSIEAKPGAVNVIPGAVTLSLDIRHADDDVRTRAVAELLETARVIAASRGLEFRVDRTQAHSAVLTDPALTELLTRAVTEAGVEARSLVSGAGHDAAIMANLAPMTMLFVRSPGGISHHPDEEVLIGDVRIALDVLIRWLFALKVT